MNVVNLLERGNSTLKTVFFYSLLFAISYIDYSFGAEISFSLFYLIPISAISWLQGVRYGFISSVFSAVLWEIADYKTGHLYSTVFIRYWDWGVRFGFFLIVNLLVSQLKRVMDREKEKAVTDSLTGLSNRRAFHDHAELELKRAKRYNHNFSVAYIDLDNFKVVNDTYGHLEGDELLKAVANELRKSARETDIVARLGGDEFALLFTEVDLDQSEKAVDKIFLNLKSLMEIRGWNVTLSIGLVFFEKYPEHVNDMIKLADDLMYDVKRMGKNGLRVRKFA